MSKDKDYLLLQRFYQYVIAVVGSVSLFIGTISIVLIATKLPDMTTPSPFISPLIIACVLFILMGFILMYTATNIGDQTTNYKKLKQKYNSLLQKQNP